MIDTGTRRGSRPRSACASTTGLGQHVLLYPERGLELSDTAAEIAQLCTGELSAAAIVERLHARHDNEPRARIEAEVLTFLAELEARGLLAPAEAGA
jgi:coenzyme PQQ biosynthesis protein PqqD